MVLQTSAPTGSRNSSSSGQIALRITGTDHDGRIVRVRAAKFTIGASTDCALRLVFPGIGPVHCLVHRGQNGMGIRCLSGDTRLNGQVFADSKLEIGDRISIGPIDLIVLSHEPTRDSNFNSESSSGFLPEFPARAELVESTESSSTLSAGFLEEQLRVFMDRERDLLKQEFELTRAREDFDRRVLAWETECDQRLGELNTRSSQLAAEANRLDLDRQLFAENQSSTDSQQLLDLDRLSTECSGLRDQLAELQLERDRVRDELQTRLQENAQQIAEWKSERDRLEQQLSETRSNLESLNQELANQQLAKESELEQREHDLDLESDRLEAARAALEERQASLTINSWNDEQGKLQAEWTELAAQRHALEEERAHWEETHRIQLAELQHRCSQLEQERDDANARVGTLESELGNLEGQAESQEQVDASAWHAERARLAEQLQVKQDELDVLTLQWQEQREEMQRELDQRSDELYADLERLQLDRTALAREREAWDLQRTQESQDLQAATERAEEFERERTDLQQQVLELQELRSAFETERDRDLREIELERRQFQAERTAWEHERRQAEQDLEDRVLSLETQLNQAIQETSVSDSSGIVNSMSSIVDALDAGDEDSSSTIAIEMLEQLRSQQGFSHDDHDADESDSSSPVMTEEELEFSTPPSAPPVDTASILAKFGYATDDDDDGSVDDRPAPAPQAVVAHVSHEDAGGENDIQDYMARLLQRVGSGSHVAKEPEPEPIRRKTEMRPKTTAVQRDNAAEKPLTAGEFVPRARAPEAPNSLQSLRDLANTSARTDIDKHRRKRHEALALLLWFIAIVSFAVGSTAIYYAMTHGIFTMSGYTAMGGFAVSACCVFQALAMTARAKLGGLSKRTKANETQSASDQAANTED